MVLNRHHLLPHVPVPAFFSLPSRIVWYMHLPRGVPGIGGLSSPASLFLLRFVPYSKVCKRGLGHSPSQWPLIHHYGTTSALPLTRFDTCTFTLYYLLLEHVCGDLCVPSGYTALFLFLYLPFCARLCRLVAGHLLCFNIMRSELRSDIRGCLIDFQASFSC